MAVVVCGYRGSLELDIVHNVKEEMVNRIGSVWDVRNVVSIKDIGIFQVGPRNNGIFPVGSRGSDVVDFRCSEVGEARAGSVSAAGEEDDVITLIGRN